MSGTRRKPGSMGPHISGFEARLLGSGYTPGTVRHLLAEAGQLGRWMATESVEICQLSEASVESFRWARRQSGYRKVPGPRGLEELLAYLRGLGLVAAEAVSLTPVERLIVDYRAWLVGERGLAAMTVLRYENLARRFLEERFAAAGDGFVSVLAAPAVTAFLLRETARVSVGAAKGRVAELRSLLRFLYLKGWTPAALATAVPPVAGWHDVGLPRGAAAGDVERLLAGCDRTSRVGARDFAILMLVARLGLRSIEVARLEVGDIDWRAGVIVVRGKARRQDRLPLPSAVGEALSDYLCQGRPATSIRQVFLATKAPTRAIRADLVSDVT